MNDSNRWEEHNRLAGSKNLPPAQTLLKAIEHIEEWHTDKNPFCIDLGCGSGIDTLALLEKGWRVLAIDKEPAVIKALKAKVPGKSASLLSILPVSFEETDLPDCDLLNASFSLPYCSPDRFNGLWRKIETALKPGAFFAGHFFGLHDSWASRPEMSFHSREQIEQLFSTFTIDFLLEVDEDSQAINGKQKHWHVFHIVARKV